MAAAAPAAQHQQHNILHCICSLRCRICSTQDTLICRRYGVLPSEHCVPLSKLRLGMKAGLTKSVETC